MFPIFHIKGVVEYLFSVVVDEEQRKNQLVTNITYSPHMCTRRTHLCPPNSYNVSFQLCDGKLDKLDGKTKFLERHKLSKMAQDSLDRPATRD